MFDNRIEVVATGAAGAAVRAVARSMSQPARHDSSARRSPSRSQRLVRERWWQKPWRSGVGGEEGSSDRSERSTDPTPDSDDRTARRTRPRMLLVTASWADIASLRLLLGPIADLTVALNAADARDWWARADLDVVLWDLDLGSSTPVDSLLGTSEVREELERRIVYLAGQGSAAWPSSLRSADPTVLRRPLDPQEVLQAMAQAAGALPNAD